LGSLFFTVLSRPSSWIRGRGLQGQRRDTKVREGNRGRKGKEEKGGSIPALLFPHFQLCPK